MIYTIPTASPIHYVTYVRDLPLQPDGRLGRLHARLSGNVLLAVGHRRLRHRLVLPAVDRPLLVRRAEDVGIRRRHQLEPVDRLERRLRLGRLPPDLRPWWGPYYGWHRPPSGRPPVRPSGLRTGARAVRRPAG